MQAVVAVLQSDRAVQEAQVEVEPDRHIQVPTEHLALRILVEAEAEAAMTHHALYQVPVVQVS
jgi:hypothetical protein